MWFSQRGAEGEKLGIIRNFLLDPIGVAFGFPNNPCPLTLSGFDILSSSMKACSCLPSGSWWIAVGVFVVFS